MSFEDLEKKRLKESYALQRLEHLSEWHSIAFITKCFKNDDRAIHRALWEHGLRTWVRSIKKDFRNKVTNGGMSIPGKELKINRGLRYG